MASASNAARLCLLACRQAPRLKTIPQAQRLVRPIAASRRALSTSPVRWADELKEPTPAAAEPAAEECKTEASSTQSVNADTDLMGFELLDRAAKEHGYLTFDEYVMEHVKRGKDAPGSAAEERKLEEQIRNIDVGERAEKSGFWFDEDDPECSTQEHDEFDEDDITEMAHGKLEEIREMRAYQRLAVWELPLLSKLAKPFEPPTEKQLLRWRYTTYFGDSHPAEKKVVVQFAPDDLGLTPMQADKLKKLAGPRFNPENELIKMSCESYPHQAQNKRYLSNLVDDMIAAAKDPKDTFEDIPLDLRHHIIKPKPRFPKEWFMTEQRRKELDSTRQQLSLADFQSAQSGKLVDGKKVIERYLLKKAEEEAEKQKLAELVPVGRVQGKPALWATKSKR